MYTWKELTDKFEELQDPLRHAFISVQWGDAGVNIYLQGVQQGTAPSKFKSLSELAGKKLDSLPDEIKENFPGVFQELNFYERWLKMIWKAGAGVENQQIGYEEKDGEIVGTIHSGSISNPAQQSANLCLKLSVYDQKEIGWGKWLWKEYGKEIFIGLILIFLGIMIGKLI